MIIFVSDAFSQHYTGGAELTTDAIIDASLYPVNKVLSRQVTLDVMEKNKDCFWIFGNFTQVPVSCLLYAAKNLSYSVIEYDYKFCVFRSVKKHELNNNECNCSTSPHGKMVAAFLARSKMNFWMSREQKDFYISYFPFLKNNFVLNSVFSQETLRSLKSLDTSKKNNKWLILDSPSWIKGKEKAVKYAEENSLEYELVWGIKHEDMLQKLALSKGLILLPEARDTCPRLAMEAKALDCELILNENVQHKNEDWFQTKELMFSHLEKNANIFWKKIEEVSQKELNITKQKTVSKQKIKVIVPFYNAQDWLAKCVKSLKMQDHESFECFLIDDISTDESLSVVTDAVGADNRFTIVKNTNKGYALKNIADTLENNNFNDEDVVVLLDGDDWLASTYSLSTLASTYDKEECFLTYGSYVYNPSGARGVEPSQYPDHVVENNSFREDSWRASHLRSFKYSLWKHIRQKDLKDTDGEYYKMTYDQAIMLPLLELAGEKSHYIYDTLYVYNKANPLNVDKIKQKKQYELSLKIRQKSRYKPL
tara:strand:+ start:418 stop:2028 length:1611 start_codon:yes stop_codon:yes gene_type:complete